MSLFGLVVRYLRRRKYVSYEKYLQQIQKFSFLGGFTTLYFLSPLATIRNVGKRTFIAYGTSYSPKEKTNFITRSNTGFIFQEGLK